MQAQRMPVTAQTRCLVIEDNLFDQKMIQRTLSCASAEIELDFATTLATARRFLALHHYAVILCDNNLPDGNGTDFAQDLANNAKYNDTRIVIVSGWPSPFMWAKAKAAGLQVVDKNDQPQVKLMQIIRQRFGLRRLRAPATVTELKPKST